MARVAVIGTTSWGTTLAALLARNGHQTLLLARTPAETAQLQRDGENVRHRPGLRFPTSLSVADDVSLLADVELVVLAVPSASLAANLARISSSEVGKSASEYRLETHLAPDASILSAIKGIDAVNARRMSELIEAAGIAAPHVLVLSGPNFADEIAAGLPAASVVAGRDAERVRRVQALLTSPTFRVYTSDDVVGVELGGALKNVVAIACGLSDGLGYGENAKAALITRALAEITRLGVALGARPLTFLGLAGMGDLILSCESDLSRNRRLGLALAKHRSLAAALAEIDGVVEGAETARSVPLLAARAGVELPLCAALHDVLYADKAPDAAVRELMARSAKAEFPDGAFGG